MIDMGCGIVRPIRKSSLAMIGRYQYSLERQAKAADKAFPSHVINVTTHGEWEFRGSRSKVTAAPGTVTLGAPSEAFSCAHHTSRPNANLIACLGTAALDPDLDPLFDSQALELPNFQPLLHRALSSESQDEFDSRVFEIFDLVSRLSKPSNRVPAQSVRMQRVKRFIDDHASEDLALADIASSVGLNPFVCLRQFKAAFGTTPHAYSLSRRAAHARQLLSSTALSIGDVARRTGFRDYAYFSRFFKRIVGVTPTQFRASVS